MCLPTYVYVSWKNLLDKVYKEKSVVVYVYCLVYIKPVIYMRLVPCVHVCVGGRAPIDNRPTYTIQFVHIRLTSKVDTVLDKVYISPRGCAFFFAEKKKKIQKN